MSGHEGPAPSFAQRLRDKINLRGPTFSHDLAKPDKIAG
jgi:hypothetical protein